MLRLVLTNPHCLLHRNAICLTRSLCSSSQTLDPVQRVTDILTHKSTNWLSLLDSSDIANSLDPDVVRSVIRRRSTSEPKRLVEFFLWSETKLGTLKDLNLYSFLVVSLCNSGSLIPARNVIDRMIEVCKSPLDVLGSVVECFRGVDSGLSKPVVFDILIDRYRHLGFCVEAGDVFLCLNSVVEFKPSLLLCSSLLGDLLKANEIGMFWKVCDRMSEMKIEFDSYAYSSIIGAHFRSGNVDAAKRAFYEMDEKRFCSPNVVTYKLMIYGLCRAGLPGEAFEMKSLMVEKGLAPDKNTYMTLVTGCCKRRRFDDAKRVLSEMVEAELKPDLAAYGAVINGLVKLGRLEEAFEIKDGMIGRGVPVDLVIYKALLSGVCKANNKMKAGRVREIVDEMKRMGITPNLRTYLLLLEDYCQINDMVGAFRTFNQIRMNFAPSIVAHRIMIQGLCSIGNIEKAHLLIKSAIRSGLKLNSVIYNSLILAHLREGKVDEAERILDRMNEQGVSPDTHTYNSLIIGLCKAGKFESANIYLDKLSAQGLQPNKNAYEACVRMYCKQANFDRATRLLEEMRVNGINPDITTYNTLIDGQCKAGNVEEAKRLFRGIFGHGLSPDSVTYLMMMDCYCKSRDVAEAFKLLDGVPRKGGPPSTVVAHSALLDACCKYGMLEEAKGLLRDMLMKGLASTKSFNKLIGGLCEMKRIREANHLLEEMSENKIQPDCTTYSTMIDHHCKAQNMDEARRLFLQMQRAKLKPTVVTFTSLLGGYNVAGDTFEVFALFEEMVAAGIEPDKRAYNIVLDAHCKDGNIAEAMKLRNEMIKKGFPTSITIRPL